MSFDPLKIEGSCLDWLVRGRAMTGIERQDDDMWTPIAFV